MKTGYNFTGITATNLEELSRHNEKIKEHSLVLAKGDKVAADEGVQQMYLNIHNYFEKHPGVEITEQLVSLSLRNAIRNFWKTQNRSVPLEYDLNDGYSEPDFDEDLRNEYEKLTEELPKDLQDKLTLYSNNKTREVAEIEGKSIQQVREDKRNFREEIQKYNPNKQ